MKADIILYPSELSPREEGVPVLNGPTWTTDTDRARIWLYEDGPLLKIGPFYKKGASRFPAEVREQLQEDSLPDDLLSYKTWLGNLLPDIKARPMFEYYCLVEHRASRGAGKGRNFGTIPEDEYRDRPNRFWKFSLVSGHLSTWGVYIAYAPSLGQAKLQAKEREGAEVYTKEQLLQYFEKYGLDNKELPEWETKNGTLVLKEAPWEPTDNSIWKTINHLYMNKDGK